MTTGLWSRDGASGLQSGGSVVGECIKSMSSMLSKTCLSKQGREIEVWQNKVLEPKSHQIQTVVVVVAPKSLPLMDSNSSTSYSVINNNASTYN